VTRAIDAFVDEKVEETGFSGTVLIAKGGEVWHESAHGLAHRGYGIANHPGTRFDLGSINKIFTKVAVAQLAAAGKLGLDDTIADHLPDYPNPEVAARVTVRQLAEHTSGLGDVFVPAFTEASKTRFRKPEDFFPLFAHEPLLFEPGTGRQYSNAGYQVLGAIVAAASGMPYHDYVAEKVWAPAGMAATAFVARDEPTPDVAVGYTTRTEDGRLRNNLFRLPVVGSPAGSSFSTVDDMLRFAEALRGGSLVPEGWTAWLLAGDEPGAEAPDPDELGLGFAGGAPGVNAMLRIAGPWTVVVLANQDPPVAGKLAQPLGNALEQLGR
jgi:CubicO group peptidase (beta-lactamase class C family)